MRTLNRLRWRLASRIAPGPILAAPLGESKAFILLRPDNRSLAWVATKTLDLTVEHNIAPITDDLALGTWRGFGSTGTFSGTI